MPRQERFPYPRPPVRPLKIYAFDPMVGLDRRTRVSVETRNEPLKQGPVGARIAVVDYDGTFDCFYVPVDLDDPAILMQGGIEPSEGDPRFHQQMVYAVASRIVEIFDRALGRPVDLARTKTGKARPIRLFPHAFCNANAYYNPELGAILFGYFRAPDNVVGANIPGQMIFSCLSHDVIAHELTHALIHQLSPALLNSEHPDTLALHEGLADLVAILHRFSIESIVRDEVQQTRGMLDVNSNFCKVASQFGAALGKAHGIRDAREPANPTQYATVLEPHARGALLISAVLEALFRSYRHAVQDLMEIAAISGTPATGELHPDLVNRLATEVSRLARSLLTMCIRAFDYLPPVDVSFGDFLRSAVTADWELSPADYSGIRSALVESFRSRGIYATGARSLAEESLIWERPEKRLDPLPASIVAALTENAQMFGRIRPGEGERTLTDENPAQELYDYAAKNARALNLWQSNDVKLDISGTRYCFRVGADGQLSVDIVAKFIQSRQRGSQTEYRGTTLVAAADGSVRYVITNQPLPRLDQHLENHAPALVGNSSRANTMQPPFPARYRMSAAQYKKKFPGLVPSNDEMDSLKAVLGFQ